ncbi:MAG: hypothetical protein RLZ18_950 [Actinomycetota bacterium]|jgi:hypothetical protein
MVMVAWLLPTTTVGAPGASGGASGVTEALFALAVLEPKPLFAVAEKVYAVPLVSPVMVHVVAGTVTVHVAPPGVAVTV